MRWALSYHFADSFSWAFRRISDSFGLYTTSCLYISGFQLQIEFYVNTKVLDIAFQ